jgi:hypothetical protein
VPPHLRICGSEGLYIHRVSCLDEPLVHQGEILAERSDLLQGHLLDEMDGPIQEIDRRMQVAMSSEDASRLTEILEDLRDRLEVSELAE